MLALLMPACVSMHDFENMRERATRAEARVAEQQGFIAGCQDDLSHIQSTCIREVDGWRTGALMQAERIARLRNGCSL